MEEELVPILQVPDIQYGTSGEIFANTPLTIDTSIMEYMCYDEMARVIRATGILPINTGPRKRVIDLIDFVEEMGEFNKINQEDKQELINKINQLL